MRTQAVLRGILAGWVCSGFAAAAIEQWTSPDPEVAGRFGSTLASVPGRLPNDPAKLLVGTAWQRAGGVLLAGKAYLLDVQTGAVLLALESPNPEGTGSFASTVAAVPDVTGDGHPELLIGAPREDAAGLNNAGRVYLFNGLNGGLLQTVQAPQPQVDTWFGEAIAGLPDIDGDGRGDIAVGVPRSQPMGAVDAGRVFLFSGATGAPLRTLESPNLEGDGRFGACLAGLPDLNNDGRGDLLVGAPGETVNNQRQSGRVYLFSGADGALLQTFESPRNAAFGWFGSTLAVLGDVNGDGLPEFVVGANTEDGDGFNGVRHVYVVDPATQVPLYHVSAPGARTDTWFGDALAAGQDLNGDGLSDCVEQCMETNPLDVDTDGDGMHDAFL